ncbi:hypothetical protein KR51_00031840 [Rubidibacter lacunae KORDI 51-2]|uniref:Uncharacterized protein n=1 Tax=Rubidibacter lacunae KORDI 51-2 TaxID=582515 RepID=U5D6G5_9CHRO|nr:hypothetical protein [Rubidibacter lacunae]ERN40243.1 hypothetical protein KR51_00031840 [Rubidibacter lacunae KORDI 51-2]
MLAAGQFKTRSLLVVATMTVGLALWRGRYGLLVLGGVAIALTWRG